MAAGFGQATVGIVFAQLQPILGAAGEHAVRLADALGDQVVHQHAQVGLVSPRQPAVASPGCARACLKRSIHAGKQALCRSLFIPGGAVDLASKKQPAQRPGLKSAFELLRVKVVVLNRIAGPQDMRVFQTRHRAHQLVLDIKRQAGRNAVGVVLVGAQAFGLQKNLVALFVRKAVDLVLYARAIPRPDAFDLASEHGAASKTTADDLVGAGIGVGHPARHLGRMLLSPPQKTEHRHLLVHAPRHAVASLLLAAAKVNRAPVKPRGRAGL